VALESRAGLGDRADPRPLTRPASDASSPACLSSAGRFYPTEAPGYRPKAFGEPSPVLAAARSNAAFLAVWRHGSDSLLKSVDKQPPPGKGHSTQ